MEKCKRNGFVVTQVTSGNSICMRSPIQNANLTKHNIKHLKFSGEWMLDLDFGCLAIYIYVHLVSISEVCIRCWSWALDLEVFCNFCAGLGAT